MLKQKLLDILSFIGLDDMVREKIQEKIIDEILIKLGTVRVMYGKDILKLLGIDSYDELSYPGVCIYKDVLYQLSIFDKYKLIKFMKIPLEEMPLYLNKENVKDNWYPFLSWYRLKIGR